MSIRAEFPFESLQPVFSVGIFDPIKSVGRVASDVGAPLVPFLAVCPECHYAQVCVLPTRIFPRIKCGRCREIYDPVGTEDTEIIPELAGSTVARLVRERRANRAEVRAARERRRRKRRSRARKLVAAGAAASPSAEQIAAAVLSEPMPVVAADPPADETGPEAGVDPTAPATGPGPVIPTGRPRPIRKRIRRKPRAETAAAAPLSAGSFFLLGAALVTAPIDAVGFLARPLAVISFLLGLWAVRAAVREEVTARYAMLVTGLAGAVTLAALLSPGLIGIEQRGTPDWAETDVQVVPHPQYVGDLNVWKAEWADASKASLQQGAVRVEIVGVRTGRGSAELRPSLLVHLRLNWTAGLDAPADQAAWGQHHRAALWDSDGNRYDQITALAGPAATKALGGQEVSPEEGVDVLLEFARPPRPNTLRLELPAAAWGGRGQFRFTIPAGMVKW
jgi:hypothetical protein